MRGAEKLITLVEHWLDILYIDAEGAGLRNEDRRKALELAAILPEIERVVRRFSKRSPILMVDAAAGKSYVGLLAANLILEPLGRSASVVLIERERRRVELSRRAVERLRCPVPIECRCADVADPSAWPAQPDLVVALHACGAAADTVIDRTIAASAKALLLVPCCTSNAVPGTACAQLQAELGKIPRQAPIRRRFIQICVDSERTWRLEAAGYETEVVEFVGATVTPHNLLWRSRRVCEPARVDAARTALKAWRRSS